MRKSNWRPAALSLTVLGAFLRLLPHPPNFAPVGSTSVFAGARLAVWQAYLIPLALMAVTDPIIAARYGEPAFTTGRLWVYASFMISVWLGRRVRSTTSALKIGGVVLASSVQFFLITNFGTWLNGLTLAGGHYPRTLAGLVECYTYAIPFFGWTVCGDLFYAGVLFGAHAWLSHRVARAELVTA